MDTRNNHVLPRRTVWQRLWDLKLFSILVCCGIVYCLLHTTRTDREPHASSTPLQPVLCNFDDPVRSVAIVGAGSGGASAAYYLNKLKHPCTRINITVYERSSYIGGRSTTVDVHGLFSEPVETGASIFVEVNKNLVSAVDEFGLSTQAYNAGSPGKLKKTLGIYNGQQWVFRSSDSGWWDVAKMLWKYGMAPIRTRRLMKSTVGPFLKMYEEPSFPFRDLSQTVYDLGLTEATALTGSQYLNENGIDTSEGSFATDIVQASTRVNYAQNIDKIHGLEAMVCMATDGAMQVRGGNWQIFEGMLKASGANTLLNTSVSSIQREPNGTYTLEASFSSELVAPSNYDTIIVAAPLQFADLTLTPPPVNPPPKIPYVDLHVTLFTSPRRLDPQAFNLETADKVPTTVLTVPGASAHEYFSISTIRTLINPHSGEPEYLYKIFSPKRLSILWIESILLSEPNDAESKEVITWIYEKLWQSYPYLPPRVTFEDIQLDREGKVWYTSGIESFISTMETSSLMGMNVARLVVDGWDGEEEADRVHDMSDLPSLPDIPEIPDVPKIPEIPKIPKIPKIPTVPEVTPVGTQDSSIGNDDDEL